MLLTKFCKYQHNIINSNKLLIGNFYKYREIEQADIADQHEVRSYIKIKLDGAVDVSSKWLDTVLQGIIGFNPGPRIEPDFRVDIRTQENDLVINRKPGADEVNIVGSIGVDFQLPNSFIFCMSVNDGKIEKKFAGYDSQWSFKIEMAQSFAFHVAQKIMERLTIDFIENDFLRFIKVSDIGNINIKWKFGMVNYNSRTYLVKKQENMTTENLFRILRESAFQKDPAYASDKEYRFIFSLFFRDKQISIKPIDLLIDCDNLREFVV